MLMRANTQVSLQGPSGAPEAIKVSQGKLLAVFRRAARDPDADRGDRHPRNRRLHRGGPGADVLLHLLRARAEVGAIDDPASQETVLSGSTTGRSTS